MGSKVEEKLRFFKSDCDCVFLKLNDEIGLAFYSCAKEKGEMGKFKASLIHFPDDLPLTELNEEEKQYVMDLMVAAKDNALEKRRKRIEERLNSLTPDSIIGGLVLGDLIGSLLKSVEGAKELAESEPAGTC